MYWFGEHLSLESLRTFTQIILRVHFYFIFSFLFIYFFFLPYLKHVEVPGPRIEPTPQGQPEPQKWWYWSLKPLCQKGTLFFSFFFLLFRATLTAYGSSQSRGQIRATAAGLAPQPRQRKIWALSSTYTIAHGNTGSRTHWARPGMEPTSS